MEPDNNDPLIPHNMTTEHGEHISAQNPSGMHSREGNQEFGGLSPRTFKADAPVPDLDFEAPDQANSNFVRLQEDLVQWSDYDAKPTRTLSPQEQIDFNQRRDTRRAQYEQLKETQGKFYRSALRLGLLQKGTLNKAVERTLQDVILNKIELADAEDRIMHEARNLDDTVIGGSKIPEDTRPGKERPEEYAAVRYGNMHTEAAKGIIALINYRVAEQKLDPNDASQNAVLQKLSWEASARLFTPIEEWPDELKTIAAKGRSNAPQTPSRAQQAAPQPGGNNQQALSDDAYIERARIIAFGSLNENMRKIQDNSLSMGVLTDDKLEALKANAESTERRDPSVRLSPELSLKDEMEGMNILAEVAEIKKKASTEDDYSKFADAKLANLRNDVLENLICKQSGTLEAVSLYTTILHDNLDINQILKKIDKQANYVLPRSFFDISTLPQIIQFREGMAYWLMENGKIPLPPGLTQQDIQLSIESGRFKDWTIDNPDSPYTKYYRMAKTAANVGWEFIYSTHLAEDRFSRFNKNLQRSKPPHTAIAHVPAILSQGMHFLMHTQERIEAYTGGGTTLDPLTRFDTPITNAGVDARTRLFMPKKLIGTSLEYVHVKTKNDGKEKSLFQMFERNGQMLLANPGVDKADLLKPDFLTLGAPAFKEYYETEVKYGVKIIDAISNKGPGIKDERESGAAIGNALKMLDLPKNYRENILKAGSVGLKPSLTRWTKQLEVRAWGPLLENYKTYSPGILEEGNQNRRNKYQTLNINE